MIYLDCVSSHDVRTKQNVMQEARKAEQLPDLFSKYRILWKHIEAAWPDSKIYQITWRGQNEGNRWLVPIDLGDGIDLAPSAFLDMCLCQFGADGWDDVEKVRLYLKRLTDEDVQVYKMMKKLEKMN